MVLGWGSTYGVIKTVVEELLEGGHKVAHAHIRYVRPFPKNLGDILRKYKTVLIPEINNGQLIKIILTQEQLESQKEMIICHLLPCLHPLEDLL